MITNKNIDEALKRQYFEWIKSFFKKCESKSERIAYIKNIYGIGGWAIPERGDFIDWLSYNDSGMEFIKRSGMNREEKIKLSWSKVVERIEKIIENESQISLF